jgi:hypothetical protein
MSVPITKQSTDYTGPESFSFGFFCDCCGKEWRSLTVPFETGGFTAVEREETRQMLWEQEHKAAFEQANVEAHLHFNHCPTCDRWVCDDCISLKDPRRETCKDCCK